jgi:hypothetical protein
VVQFLDDEMLSVLITLVLKHLLNRDFLSRFRVGSLCISQCIDYQIHHSKRAVTYYLVHDELRLHHNENVILSSR